MQQEIPTRCCFKGTKLTSYPWLAKYVNLWIEQGGSRKGAGVKKRSVDRDPLSLRSTDHVGQLLLMIRGWLTDVSVNGTLEISPPTDRSWELPLLRDTWVYLKFQSLYEDLLYCTSVPEWLLWGAVKSESLRLMRKKVSYFWQISRQNFYS